MSFGLRITDGVTTVQLFGGPDQPGTASSVGVEYELEGGELAVQETPLRAAGCGDGARVVAARRANVTETCTVSLGDTRQALALPLRQLGGLLDQARRRQETGRGRAVYVELDPQAAGTWPYRSELLAGRVTPAADLLAGYWHGRGRARIRVTWRRLPWWEAANAEPVWIRKTGIFSPDEQIANHWDTDSGHINRVLLDPEGVGGDLEAPCRLTITNESAAVVRRLWVNHNLVAAPAALGPMIEGEACLDGTRLPASASSAYSGGYFQRLAVSGASEQLLGRWSLAPAFLGACGGYYYRVLARCVGDCAHLRARLALAAAGVEVWRGAEIALEAGHQVQDLGLVPLPPAGSSGLAGLELRVLGRYLGGGGTSLDLDYLQCSPLDGWRRYEVAGGVAGGESLVDDGLAGLVYVQSGSAPRPGVEVRGAALALVPGAEQAIHVLVEDSAGVAAPGHLVRLAIAARPRHVLPVG